LQPVKFKEKLSIIIEDEFENKICLLYAGSRFEEQMLSIVMESGPALKTENLLKG
jgi:hypothetical protein